MAEHTPPWLGESERAQERALFENAMCTSRPQIDLRRHPGDYYVSDRTMEMWRGWQARAAVARGKPDMLDILQTIELGLRRGYSAAELLDENSPVRDRIRAAIAKATGES